MYWWPNMPDDQLTVVKLKKNGTYGDQLTARAKGAAIFHLKILHSTSVVKVCPSNNSMST
jgi:hypothetical protein